MPVQPRRRKQPERVRADIIRAAGDIAVERGIHAITLESVAARAGVSKGGLQHHFRAKQDLLDALFDEVSAATEAALERETASDPDEHGRAARAYLAVTSREASHTGYQAIWRVLLSAMGTEPRIRERWSERLRRLNPSDPLPDEAAARLMICRLAAEGLWISGILDSIDMSASLRGEVLRQLAALTREADGG